MNVVGNFMPPLFILPHKRESPMLMDDIPPGSMKFVEFSCPSPDKQVLLILNGNSTHTKSIELTDYAHSNNAILLCLPPHCSHQMQPLDNTFMAPLISYYQQEGQKMLVQHPGRPVTIYQCKLFGNAFIACKTQWMKSEQEFIQLIGTSLQTFNLHHQRQ
ncbi:hypothetical protein J437_LFUL019021 [Ladona fulva]|uniref:DDE-1 domain-containing protein n=1 Tax=Ladona fulva TaxID=123851 RepID=A0A8K0KQE7_LADFU|nr:hypothetical protein J437_LFUL019021 [Ladona fulva]